MNIRIINHIIRKGKETMITIIGIQEMIIMSMAKIIKKEFK